MTIQESLKWSAIHLRNAKTEQPESSANFLLRQTLSVGEEYLIMHPSQKLSVRQEKNFEKWITRRSKHEPVWYITKNIEFYDQIFVIDKNVLIPRPETEILVEKFIRENKSIIDKKSHILEIGTGSGVIIITLASKLRGELFASDISEKALKVAKKNADNLNLRTKILFKKGNLFEPWKNKKFDFILANLPYIPSQKMSGLSLDITGYEPKIALDGGRKGLEIYQKFLSQAANYLSKNGKIYCEIGDKQGPEMVKMAKRYFLNSMVEVTKDFAGFDRIITIQNN